MDEWVLISSEKWNCPACSAESRIRKDTKRKVCKKCGAVFKRD